LRAAIVGLGRWGRTLVQSAASSPRLTFTHAVEPSIEAASRFCAEQGLRLSDHFGSVLDDPAIDAIVLATPHSLHRDQVIACAAAGKHVFCEKPLALKRLHARDMIEACAKAGIVLAVGHNRRFWPAMTALRALVRSGALGTVLHLEGHNSNEHAKAITEGWRLSPEESPLGGLTGAGLHVLDAFVSLRGPVRRVKAQFLSREAGPPTLDTTSLMLEFEDGCSGTLSTVRASPFYWRVHVFGTEASAEVLGETSLVLRKSGAPPQHCAYEPLDAVRAELESFVDAIEGVAAFPVAASEVLATLAAFEAAIASAERQTMVACDGL